MDTKKPPNPPTEKKKRKKNPLPNRGGERRRKGQGPRSYRFEDSSRIFQIEFSSWLNRSRYQTDLDRNHAGSLLYNAPSGVEGGVGREGLDLHPSPRGPAGERGGTRLSASKSRLTIPGRSRVRGHPYTAPPVEMEQAPTSRPACRCKNRKANPGTRPTAYYFGHRNATAL